MWVYEVCSFVCEKWAIQSWEGLFEGIKKAYGADGDKNIKMEGVTDSAGFGGTDRIPILIYWPIKYLSLSQIKEIYISKVNFSIM